MRGTSQTHSPHVKTTWVGGAYPGLVQRAAERPVRAVEGVEGGCSAGAPVEAPTSLKQRLIQYFAYNPGEELTAKDIAVKFDLHTVYVRDMLREMLPAGAIDRRKVGKFWHYCGGMQ